MKIFCIIALALIAGRRIESNQISTIASDHLQMYFHQLPPGTSQQVLVRLYDGSSGLDIFIPMFLLKGSNAGPRLAITAAIHGDEVTGVPVVQSLIEELNVEHVNGEIVAIPVLNPFGFARYQRGGFAGKDINRSFKAGHPIGEQMYYAEKLLDMMAALALNYHVDLHTATSGNDNSFYVRADLSSPVIMDMARVMQPQIILNTTGPENSLREAMSSVGVHSVTVEMGGPVKVNHEFVEKGICSLSHLLRYLRMAQGTTMGTNLESEPVICSASQWICTNYSGLVFQKVDIMTKVTEGQILAEIQDLFGNSVLNITAPYDGIVIGKTDRLPVQYGARIVHIGKIAS